MTGVLTTFMDELIIYDYILFGSLFALFILLIILSIVLRDKKTLAIFLIFISFTLLILGCTFGYIKMHEFLYANTTSIVSQKKLTYTKAVIVEATVKNISKFDFKSCKITVKAYKVSENPLKNYLFSFNPFNKMSIVEHDIPRGQEREIELIIEPFVYTKDYNISVGASCK